MQGGLHTFRPRNEFSGGRDNLLLDMEERAMVRLPPHGLSQLDEDILGLEEIERRIAKQASAVSPITLLTRV